MRLLIFFVFVSSLIFAQTREAPKTFPVPPHSDWQGWTNLGNWKANTDFAIMDSELIGKAVEKDLASDFHEDRGSCTPKLDDVVPTAVDLGRLGVGIIASAHNSCGCSRTGNCAIYAYAREKDSYRSILRGEGWSFALVKSETGIPDIVLTSHFSAREQELMLFHYDLGKYSVRGCETETATEDSDVEVDPC
jgi:hypothetical protein